MSVHPGIVRVKGGRRFRFVVTVPSLPLTPGGSAVHTFILLPFLGPERAPQAELVKAISIAEACLERDSTMCWAGNGFAMQHDHYGLGSIPQRTCVLTQRVDLSSLVARHVSQCPPQARLDGCLGIYVRGGIMLGKIGHNTHPLSRISQLSLLGNCGDFPHVHVRGAVPREP